MLSKYSTQQCQRVAGGWRRLQKLAATLKCFSLLEPPGDCAVLHKIEPVSFLRNTVLRRALKRFTLQTVASGAIPFVHCLPIYQTTQPHFEVRH